VESVGGRTRRRRLGFALSWVSRLDDSHLLWPCPLPTRPHGLRNRSSRKPRSYWPSTSDEHESSLSWYEIVREGSHTLLHRKRRLVVYGPGQSSEIGRPSPSQIRSRVGMLKACYELKAVFHNSVQNDISFSTFPYLLVREECTECTYLEG